MDLQVLAVMFGLDYIRITDPMDTFENPNLVETRYDTVNHNRLKREFTCPRVDFSYKGKRYFGYVPVSTQISTYDSWMISRRTHVLDDEVMIQDLKKMIQDCIKENSV